MGLDEVGWLFYREGANPPRRLERSMVTQVTLDDTEYGEGRSRDAWLTREGGAISPQRNIATFCLVPRPNLSGQAKKADAMYLVGVSTGIGTYVEVGSKVVSEVRINLSHSEHQVIEDTDEGIRKLIADKVYPGEYVVAWIYTERPACPDAWAKGKKVHDGCLSEIEKLERLQRQRVHDVGPDGFEPYGSRTDLGIVVYSSFSSSAEIKIAHSFAAIRRSAVLELASRLTKLYQKDYEMDTSEEYDLVLYEKGYGEQAKKVAEERLASWHDYTFTPKQHAAFAKELRKHADEIYEEEKGKMR